jgi:hypothetical protein
MNKKQRNRKIVAQNNRNRLIDVTHQQLKLFPKFFGKK